MKNSKWAQVFHLRGNQVERVLPGEGIGNPLPDSLVLEPGLYQFEGVAYPMEKEGLYRFLSLGGGNQQRIVHDGDDMVLMASICWMLSHGYRDNLKSFGELMDIACRGKVIITCAKACDFVRHLFADLGLPIRRARGRTLEDPNGFNDGHVFTEIQWQGRWVVYDPDRGMLYRRDGRWLGVLDLTEPGHAKDVEEVSLTSRVAVAVGQYSRGGTDYDVWMETLLAKEDAREEFFGRPVQIPIIEEGEKEYYTAFSESGCARVRELWQDENLHFLPPEEFRNRFYPKT